MKNILNIELKQASLWLTNNGLNIVENNTDKKTLSIRIDNQFELELSTTEISYRAYCYRESQTQNPNNDALTCDCCESKLISKEKYLKDFGLCDDCLPNQKVDEKGIESIVIDILNSQLNSEYEDAEKYESMAEEFLNNLDDSTGFENEVRTGGAIYALTKFAYSFILECNNIVFKTEDGYLLRYEKDKDIWTDGDLEFTNVNYLPYDESIQDSIYGTYKVVNND